MSGRRIALVALAALLSAAPSPALPSEPDLDVAAPALSFSRRSITVEVSQRGALAGRRLSVIAFVDRNMIRSFPTGGERTKLVIDGLDLAPGAHDILIKSGSFEARDRFHFVSPLIPAAAAAIALIAAGFAVRRRRRRV